MPYAQIENGSVAEYPLYQGDIKLRFPSTSFPVPFTPPDGYVFVEEVPQPVSDYTKNCEEGIPELQDSVWRQTWVITDATPEEVELRTNNQATYVRFERNQRLTNSDWTQLADNTADTNAWAAYRQALRDLPAQAGFPHEITWPTEPTT